MTKNIFKTVILKLDHRPERDKRISTHCALVSRAFLANEFYFSGVEDIRLIANIEKIVDKWGGDFKVNYCKKPVDFVKKWKKTGIVIHLTMYGEKVIEKINEITKNKKDILIIVGGPKVPRVYYELADYNISITNQPHSEVAALSIILYLMNPDALENEENFKNNKIKVIPNNKIKNVVNF